MCFGSSQPPAATPEPAAAPAPAIPNSQSAQSAAQAATPSQQIGFARKAENKKRYGSSDGPSGRREDTTSTPADTGAGIRM